MVDALEQERLDLLTRLGALEANHARLKRQPHNGEGHEQHNAELLAFRRTSARTVSTSQGGTLFRKEAEDVLPEGEARHLRRLRETYRRQGTPVRR